MAASAGGLHAISTILGGLPADFPAATVIVQHLERSHASVMADILSRRTSLKVAQARHGDPLAPGHVLVAPPDRHLLVEPDGTCALTKTELVHFVRPSADLLFESVAGSCRERAIAVVLSGSGKDGSMGVRAIKKAGGTVIVQEPRTAQHSGMPMSASRTGSADRILALEDIAPAIVRLAAAKQSS